MCKCSLRITCVYIWDHLVELLRETSKGMNQSYAEQANDLILAYMLNKLICGEFSPACATNAEQAKVVAGCKKLNY